MTKWIKFLQDNDYLGIKKAIKNGADIRAVNETKESVLACALRYKCDEEIIDLLVQNGAPLDDCNEDGVNILDYAIMYNYVNLVEKIIDSGVDINETKRASGFTALMGAVCYGRGEIAKILLRYGADKEARELKGLNALDFAKKTHKKSMIKLLEES